MASPPTPRALGAYIALLTALLAAILVWSLGWDGGLFERDVPEWLLLTAIFALAEFATSLLFHYGGGRQGLSVSEAILLPMLVGLTFPQVVWGVVIAMFVTGAAQRVAPVKAIFNVASLGIAAAAAAAIWHELREPAEGLTPRNAAVAVLGVLVVALLTHALTAFAISLSEHRRFLDLTRDIANALTWNLVGNISVGILFAASFAAAEWTVSLFLLPLGALYLGYRAILRQQQERERVEGLHTASRALAASADLHHAVEGFLMAVADVVSASGVTVLVRKGTDVALFSVENEELMRPGEIISDTPWNDLLETVAERRAGVVVSGLSGGPDKPIAEALGRRDLLATPLLDGEAVVGLVAAYDRVGAEEFGASEHRLLEALAHELVLTLDSYRLFEQVAEERERFQKIFEGSKEGIALLDERGLIQAWNPALERITGYHEEDILGESWSERVLVRDMDHRRIEGMDIVKVTPDQELEVVTRQGPARWVSLLTGQVETGEDNQWVIIVRDITAEHEIEEAKSDFLSTISHELRTPLTTIKGSLQMLGRPAAAPESDVGKQMVDIMRRGADRLERLVMNLLTVSQMETGDLQVFPDEVTLQTLVESRIKTVLIDHAQVDLTSEEDVVVRADRERLGQVVEHLLDNARKFGGPEGRITIGITKENGYAHLTVSDEGPGIPRNDQEKVFDRFTRLGHLLTRETQGAGVGLFIAKTAVEAMAGEIFVESDGQNGSTFHVRIPLAQPIAVQEPATSA